MLGKLAYRNTKRNIKDYLIYLITVTASVSLIFAFNLVASSDEIVKLCSSMDAFKNSLFAVNILIIFVICFLINYTTKFMFEKRSKELGTYMLLGIKKKEIAHLVIIENILLGILAFVLAIPIGFLFSQFVSLVIVNLLGIPKTLFISLNFVSIGLLIICFLTIYVLVLLNLLTINEQISNFAQTYPTNLKASSNEALLFMRRYRFANCSCFSCCFKDAYPSSNVQ